MIFTISRTLIVRRNPDNLINTFTGFFILRREDAKQMIRNSISHREWIEPWTRNDIRLSVVKLSTALQEKRALIETKHNNTFN